MIFFILTFALPPDLAIVSTGTTWPVEAGYAATNPLAVADCDGVMPIIRNGRSLPARGENYAMKVEVVQRMLRSVAGQRRVSRELRKSPDQVDRLRTGFTIPLCW